MKGLLSCALLLAVLCAASGPAATTTTTKKKKKRAVTPAVSPQARATAEKKVSKELARSNNVENPGALVPFFEQLYRSKNGHADGPVHIIQFGDSHTAADEWTGDLRELYQAAFGDGGPGFSLAGRPFRGYHRYDAGGNESRGWHTEGLARADGDGLFGLGGVSISTSLAGESISMQAECEQLEIYFLQQPGGGELALYDNGDYVGAFSTAGDLGPSYSSYRPSPGMHYFELRTTQRAPVRLFGWAGDRARGVTYEALGINGAQATVIFKWDARILASNLARRNPALIVLAYGTNEAGNNNWVRENYSEMFSTLLGRLRQYAPTASILVIGPPDRYFRSQRVMKPMDRVDDIVEAQRDACRENGAAFWDTRARMGGKGSMRQWVTAGLAQHDYVHFAGPGYRLLGNTLFKDIMRNYDDYATARAGAVESAAQAGGGSRP